MYDLTIEGHMMESELRQIEKWASSVPENGVIVEVGSYLGRSSVCWAMSCKPSVTVYCVDTFVDDYDIFIENTKKFKNIIPIIGHSPDNICYPGKDIDIFFLDAQHENPSDIDNINYFTKFMKSGSILCGHDYYPHPPYYSPDIATNIKELEKRYSKPVIAHPFTTLWEFIL